MIYNLSIGRNQFSIFLLRIVEEVIFKSCPTPLGKKQRAFPTDQMKPADRIERIVNDLFEFGVPIEVLFDVDDLLKAKNIPKVSRSSGLSPRPLVLIPPPHDSQQHVTHK